MYRKRVLAIKHPLNLFWCSLYKHKCTCLIKRKKKNENFSSFVIIRHSPVARKRCFMNVSPVMQLKCGHPWELKAAQRAFFSRVMFSILKLDSLCKGWHKNIASNSRPQPTSGVVHIFPAVLLLMEKQECCAIVYRAIRRLRHNQHILGSSSRNYMSWKETGNNIYWGLVHQINIDCISIFIEMT